MENVPAAEGPYMLPIAKLADMLAALPSVQARFAAPDAAAALARIHFPSIDEDAIPARMPLLVLGPGDRWTWEVEAGGALNYLLPAGSIMLIAALASEHTDLEAATRDVGNFIGLMFAELAGQAAASGQVAIERIRQLFPPVKCSREHEVSFGRYYLTGHHVDWK